MTKEELKAMIDAMEQDQKGGKVFWAPEDGENIIRFLPPLKPNGEVLPYFHHKTHWIDGNPYECLEQTLTDKHGNLHEAETCPACRMSKKLYAASEKDTEERDIAYGISAKDRYIFRIVSRSKKEDQTTPEFYEVGPAIFKKFFNLMKSGKYGNIVHPVEGRDFIVDKQGTGRRTNYDNSLPEVDKTPIFTDKEDLKEVLTKATEMKYSDLIEFPTYDDMERAITEFMSPGSTDSGSVPQKPKKEVVEEDYYEEEVTPKKSPRQSKEEEPVDNDQIDDLLKDFI